MPKIKRGQLTKLDEAQKTMLARIFRWRAYRELLMDITRDLHQADRYGNRHEQPWQSGTHELSLELYRKENEAWREYLMLTLCYEDQDEARELAHKRFLEGDHEGLSVGVMHMLTKLGDEPGRYWANEEDEFKAQLERAFKHSK